MAKIDPETLPYRPCVGALVINKDRRVFIGHRADGPEEPEGPGTWWQMPQGGIDEDEDPEAAVYRELYEETSIRSVRAHRRIPQLVHLRPAARTGRQGLEGSATVARHRNGTCFALPETTRRSKS